MGLNADQDGPLEGFAAVVTGGGSGFGEATVQRLSGLGAFVGIIDKDEDAVHRAVDRVRKSGGCADGVACDVRDLGALREAMTRFAEPRSGIDILICSAGVLFPAELSTIPEEDYDRVFDVNTKGFVLAVQAALPHFTRDSKSAPNSITAISSTAGLRPKAGNTVYAASKAALEHLARGLALELAERGIRVNAIAPSTANTPLIGGFSTTTPGGYKPTGTAPIGRLCEPSDVANMVAYLASAEAAFVTGAVLHVDGGMSAGIPRETGREATG